VVELRVPALSGTSGEELLDAAGTVEVGGDGLGRIVRPSDRLRRPAPGPVLPALGRSVPRTLEGYLWSGMTSGGAAKAAWALLFPFSLANVAHWMLPPVPDGSRTAAVLGGLCRGLLRIAALLLTMLLIAQVAVITLDLFTAQCLAPGRQCLTGLPDWLRDVPQLRLTAGLLPAAAVIFVLFRISGTNWTVRAHTPPPAGGTLPGDALRSNAGDSGDTRDTGDTGDTGDTDSPVLRCVHTVAALGTVAVLAVGGPLAVPADIADRTLWIASLALIGIALVVAATGVRRLPRGLRAGLLALAVALLVAVAVRGAVPAGSDATVETVGAALIGAWLLFALLLAPAALVARRTWRELPKRLRPWAGGWAAAPALALAALIGAGFGSGLATGLRRIAGSDDLALPDSYRVVTALWGGGLLLAVVLGLFGFTVAVPLRKRSRGVPAVVRMLQAPQDRQAAAAAWARSAWERRHLHHLALGVIAGLSAGAAALLVSWYGFGTLPTWLDPLSAVGVVGLGALAVGLLRVVYTAATRPGRNRHLGALTDLVCFWPRAAHPAIPPCYALKVIPDLAARAKEHLAEPNTRVVLSGEKLGSLLALIAAARLVHTLPPGERERIGLLSAGSPLQWGYQRAFPAVLPHSALAALHGSLDGRWRGLARGTDIFGGGVTTWRHRVDGDKLTGEGYLPDGSWGALPPAGTSTTGALVLGGDHWLPDPVHPPSGARRWRAGVLGHSDYLVDAEWDQAVAIAAGLEFPAKPARGEAEQVPLFPDLPRFHLNLAR